LCFLFPMSAFWSTRLVITFSSFESKNIYYIVPYMF
jgi:hypothetical protein